MPLAAIDPPELLFSCPSLGLILALAAAAAVPAAAEMGLHNRDIYSPAGRCSIDTLAH